MLEQDPDLVIAFHVGNSPGTAHAIENASKREIPVEVIRRGISSMPPALLRRGLFSTSGMDYPWYQEERLKGNGRDGTAINEPTRDTRKRRSLRRVVSEEEPEEMMRAPAIPGIKVPHRKGGKRGYRVGEGYPSW